MLEAIGNISLIRQENINLKSVYCSFVFRGDSLRESPLKIGYSHFLEHMFFRKCEKLNQKELYNLLDENGIDMHAITFRNKIVVSFECQSTKFETALELLVDIIFNSNWEREDIEKEKKVILAEIAEKGEIFYSKINKNYFSDYYPASILGLSSSIKKITLNKIVKHKEFVFKNSKKYIIITGGFSEGSYLFLKNKLKNISNTYISDIEDIQPHIAQHMSMPKKIIFEKDYYNTDITLLIKYNKNDICYHHLKILLLILFELNSSVLNYDLRDEYGLTYSIDSNLFYNAD